MWRITTFTGTVIEVQRYINKPMRWHERPVCGERRELWLGSRHHEDEYKWVIHSKVMPARRDHYVTLVHAGPAVVGLYNATTGSSVNYVREDPPFLTRGVDVLRVLALIAAGGLGMAWGWVSPLHAFGAVLAYPIFAPLCRLVQRRRLQSVVDETLNELQIMRVVRPLRRTQEY